MAGEGQPNWQHWHQGLRSKLPPVERNHINDGNDADEDCRLIEPRSCCWSIHAFTWNRRLGACVLVRLSHTCTLGITNISKSPIPEPQGGVLQECLGSGQLESCGEAIQLIHELK